MLRWSLLVCAVLGAAAADEAAACQPAPDGNSYRLEELFREQEPVVGGLPIVDGLTMVDGLAINWKTNDIYFMVYHMPDYSTSYVMNIENKSRRVLGVLPKTCKHALDQQTGRLYAACFDYHQPKGGLYVYDLNIKKFVRLDEKNRSIRDVQFSGALYYIDPDGKLHTFVKGHAEQVPKLQNTTVRHFLVLDNGDIVFYSLDGYFYLKAYTTEPIRLSGISLFSNLQFAKDPEGNTYGYSNERVYRLNVTSASFDTSGVEVPRCSGLVATKDGGFVFLFRDVRILHLAKCSNE